MSSPVEVKDLCKSFGRIAAVRELSFAAEAGSIYGLIGPNGAGKTTTLSILAGLVSPTSGSASVLGLDVRPNRRELVSRVGFATPQLTFFDYLSGAEILLTCALMHGVAAREAERRIRDLLVLFDLEGAAGQYLYQYSHGMRQKLGLACALVHAPEVLFLDEPFVALDPASVFRIVRTLRRFSAGGRTVVLTSHDLALVESLCDRVGILHQGTLKREIPLSPPSGSGPANPRVGLESVLWEVVGAPEVYDLSWI